MGKYLRTYKQYPPGSLLVTKNYSLIKRFWYWIRRKRRPYNFLYILPTKADITISKLDLLLNDYFLFIPKKPYNKKEQRQLEILAGSCKTTEDYFAVINIIRPNTVDDNKDLDQLKDNLYYTKYWLDEEPFQNVELHS